MYDSVYKIVTEYNCMTLMYDIVYKIVFNIVYDTGVRKNVAYNIVND